MPALKLVLEGDGALREYANREFIHLGNDAPPLIVTGLAGGMTSGAPSVGLTFELPDGRVVFAETSMKLFLSAADALKARYGDPRRSDWNPRNAEPDGHTIWVTEMRIVERPDGLYSIIATKTNGDQWANVELWALQDSREAAEQALRDAARTWLGDYEITPDGRAVRKEQDND